MCHCNSCRRMTGTLCLTVIFLPPYYSPSQAVLDQLTGFVFSKRITQYFCTTCGCQMLARLLADGDDPNSQVTWDVATGSLEHIEDVVDWQGHEHIRDTLDGGFADFLAELNGEKVARWPGHFEEDEQLPLPWTLSTHAGVKASAEDKLHGHCKCGGVEFWIFRPSARTAFAKKYWPSAPPADVSALQRPLEEDTVLRDRGTKFLAGLCACNSCRLASGVEITAWAFVPTMDIALDQEGKIPWSKDFGTLKQYQSSNGAYRYFCGRCGAIVFYDADDRMWFKDIAVGILNASEGARAESWLGWRTRCLGYRDDAVPRAESLALAVENGLREWEERRPGEDLSGGSQSGGAL